MYRLIACDMDETLLRDDKTVSKENREAIHRAREMGVKFIPATGRNFVSVESTLRDLGLYDAEGEYVISFNGGVITENKNNKIIHFDGISFELASSLYERGRELGVCIHIYTTDKIYAYNLVQEELDYVEGRMVLTETFEKDLEFLRGQRIVKALYMDLDFDHVKALANEVTDITEGKVTISYSANRYIEFNNLGVDKGEGLLRLAQLLGVDLSDTIAIGDNYNDVAMIKKAGLGVGVRNCHDDMKPICDYVCVNDNNNSAVAEVIERFILK